MEAFIVKVIAYGILTVSMHMVDLSAVPDEIRKMIPKIGFFTVSTGDKQIDEIIGLDNLVYDGYAWTTESISSYYHMKKSRVGRMFPFTVTNSIGNTKFEFALDADSIIAVNVDDKNYNYRFIENPHKKGSRNLALSDFVSIFNKWKSVSKFDTDIISEGNECYVILDPKKLTTRCIMYKANLNYTLHFETICKMFDWIKHPLDYLLDYEKVHEELMTRMEDLVVYTEHYIKRDGKLEIAFVDDRISDYDLAHSFVFVFHSIGKKIELGCGRDELAAVTHLFGRYIKGHDLSVDYKMTPITTWRKKAI